MVTSLMSLCVMLVPTADLIGSFMEDSCVVSTWDSSLTRESLLLLLLLLLLLFYRLYHFDMRTNTISMVSPIESEELMKDMYMDCHSMVYMGNSLYIFGGRLRGNFLETSRLSDRLYCFNLKSKKWLVVSGNIQAGNSVTMGGRLLRSISTNQFIVFVIDD